MVFFPDPPQNIYQLRQWFAPLETLDAAYGVTVIAQDSRSAKLIREETPLATIVAGHTRTVGSLLASGAVRVVLYVGQANANAVALRSPSVLHVFLNHGDSDKLVSVSNQVKAFDFAFVAGQAAVDRHVGRLMLFDAEARLRIVGRPQLPPHREPTSETTVLYAPTWEGTHVTNAYSSVRLYGETLVTALLAEPDLSVIYRPHPRTGATDARYADADLRIRALGRAAGERFSVDTHPDPAIAFSTAHVMIADVSAIATDWLGQGRPLITAMPAEHGALIAAPAEIVAQTPHVDMGTAHAAGEIVHTALSDERTEKSIAKLAGYYLGGLSGDAATAKLVEACGELIAQCDAERARLGVA